MKVSQLTIAFHKRVISKANLHIRLNQDLMERDLEKNIYSTEVFESRIALIKIHELEISLAQGSIDFVSEIIQQGGPE